MVTREQWRDIAGYEGLYRISNHGRVLSLARVVQSSGVPYSVRKRYLRPVPNPNSSGIAASYRKERQGRRSPHLTGTPTGLNSNFFEPVTVTNHLPFWSGQYTVMASLMNCAACPLVKPNASSSV